MAGLCTFRLNANCPISRLHCQLGRLDWTSHQRLRATVWYILTPVHSGLYGRVSGSATFVVDDLVPGEVARGLLAEEGAGDLALAVGVVVEYPGRQGDG